MINAETLELIKEFEGCELKAYPDPGSRDGKPWTIGWGHTGGLSGPPVARGMTITQAQADEYLVNDLEAVGKIVDKYVKTFLNDNQYGALISFVFNIGEGQFAKSSVLKFVNEGKLNEVPGRMALYRLNDGKVMKGLVRRRTAEGALWMKVTGITEDDGDITNMQGQPASPKKPWDWGVAGGLITLLASLSADFKKLIGNLTETIGVSPLYVLGAAGLGFAAYTIYKKWKDR